MVRLRIFTLRRLLRMVGAMVLGAAGAVVAWPGVAWAGDWRAPPGYYDGAFGLSGGALEAALHEIIRDHTVQPYTQAFQADAWDALKVLDRDPADAARVIEVFSGASVPANDTSGGGNPDITESSWEREHLWPRSYGIGNIGADHADLFNLRPINPQVNQTRGNRIFDDPDALHSSDPAVPVPGAPECRYDASGGQGRLWAPRPVEKGEIARAMFYMQVRYDGRDEESQNLTLGDDPVTDLGRFGRLSTMLGWHAAAEVSERELRRNQRVFEDYQGNRNPFVDVPEFVERVFLGSPPPAGLNVMLNRRVMGLNDGAGALTGIVSLAETAATDTVVSLEGDFAVSGLAFPDSVTIAAGHGTATFTVDALAAVAPQFDAFRESWTLKASAPGYGEDMAGVTVLGSAGRGWETFDGLLIYGSAYRDGSFVGNDGVRWEYFHATAQQSFPIDGRGLLLRNQSEGSRLVSQPIPGGLGSLAIDLRKAFTGTGARQVEVVVNGVSRGFSPTFGAAGGANDAVVTWKLDGLEVAGDFTLEIRNASGGQLVVDNVRWSGWPDGAQAVAQLGTFPARIPMPSYTDGEDSGEGVRFRVFGKNLGAGGLSVSVPAEFEVALDDGPFGTEWLLPEAVDGMASVFLRARLRDGLPAGNYAGELVVEGGCAVAFVADVFGSVEEDTSGLFPGLTVEGYRQDFSEFALTGELPFGWEVTANGTASNRLDVSLWGVTATGIKRGTSEDPVLGYQHAGQTGVAVLRVQLENHTGQTLQALDVEYLARSARLNQDRFPEFTMRVNGVVRGALGHRSEEGDGLTKRERISGLSVAPGGIIELEWSSDRGDGDGASRQIGLSDLRVGLPGAPVITLDGPVEVWLEQGTAFVDPGAVAVDEYEGDLAVTVVGSVDTDVPGTTVLVYQAVNSLGVAAAEVTRAVTVLSPFDYFARVTHGLSGDAASATANPSGDGVANLLKFALGGDPAVADPTVLPQLVVMADGVVGLRFRTGREFAWDASAAVLAGAGVEVFLVGSEDLEDWQPLGGTVVGAAVDDPVAAGTWITLVADGVPAGGRFFLRLAVRETGP